MKLRNLHIADPHLFVLYFGFISTLGSAVWCFLCQDRLKELYPLSYRAVMEDGIHQIMLSAALHLILAAVVWLDARKQESRQP
jgi:hypothetical protein